MAVLDLLGLVAAPEVVVGGAGQHVLHGLKIRRRHGSPQIHVGQHVVGILLVDGYAAAPHGLLRVQADGVLLVLHPNELEGPAGSDGVLSHHGGDVVPVVAHPGGEQLPVGDILMGLLYRPGVAGGGELDVGHVEAGDHLNDAGQGLGGGDIHGLYDAVGDGAVEYLCHQHGTLVKIVGIPGPARHLVGGVHPVDASSNFHNAHLLVEPIITDSIGERKGEDRRPSPKFSIAQSLKSKNYFVSLTFFVI